MLWTHTHVQKLTERSVHKRKDAQKVNKTTHWENKKSKQLTTRTEKKQAKPLPASNWTKQTKGSIRTRAGMSILFPVLITPRTTYAASQPQQLTQTSTQRQCFSSWRCRIVAFLPTAAVSDQHVHDGAQLLKCLAVQNRLCTLSFFPLVTIEVTQSCSFH